MRIASETLNSYDEAADTYHCSYGPPIPAATIHDPERGVLVRVDPKTRQVVGFSIPEFKAWYAEHTNGTGSGIFRDDLFRMLTPVPKGDPNEETESWDDYVHPTIDNIPEDVRGMYAALEDLALP